MDADTLRLLGAGSIGLITAVASIQALRHSTLGCPGLIGSCVGALAFIGLLRMGDGLLTLVLIPYVALGLALAFLLLAKWVRVWVPPEWRRGAYRPRWAARRKTEKME